MSIPTILIIEDNTADVFLIRNCLEELGVEYRLELLVDGEAALQFIDQYRKGDRQPDPCVILLDLHLPKYNGAQVLAAIRVEPVMKHMKVMVLTSMVDPKQREEIEDLGALCRVKPSKLSEYQELAAEIIAVCKGFIVAA